MQAVVIGEYGGPEVLQLQEIPNLEPGRGEVRVKVHASALNRADIEQRKGNYLPPIPSEYEIPGLEFAGVVDKLGAGVSNWWLGDRRVHDRSLDYGAAYPAHLCLLIEDNVSLRLGASGG